MQSCSSGASCSLLFASLMTLWGDNMYFWLVLVNWSITMLALTMMNDNDTATKFRATTHILFIFCPIIVLIIHIWPNSKDPLFGAALTFMHTCTARLDVLGDVCRLRLQEDERMRNRSRRKRSRWSRCVCVCDVAAVHVLASGTLNCDWLGMLHSNYCWVTANDADNNYGFTAVMGKSQSQFGFQ